MGWFGRKKEDNTGPDYSIIDSLEKAQSFAKQGKLVPMLLLPEQFGGNNTSVNVVYVPEFAADLKNGTDVNVIAPLVAAGKVTRYNATPEYFGKSFVPIAVRLTASDPENFTYDIAIWGPALNRAK